VAGSAHGISPRLTASNRLRLRVPAKMLSGWCDISGTIACRDYARRANNARRAVVTMVIFAIDSDIAFPSRKQAQIMPMAKTSKVDRLWPVKR